VATAQLEGVNLTDVNAKKIIKIAIEQEAYDSDMPKSKKERLDAAHEIIAFCIDAWKNDGARPDDDDPEIAEGAKAILDIFELADIEVGDDDEILFPESESDDDDDEDETDDEDEDSDDEDDDEDGPFDPDDYIDGYTELSTKTKLAKIKKLDPEDEDDAGILTALKDWEEQQDKPNARVLDALADLIDDEEDEDDDDDEGEEVDGEVEDDDDDEDDDSDDEEESDDGEEPWPGYDKATAVKVKEVLSSEFEKENLTEEHIQYVIDYENERPQPRKRIITLCEQLLSQLDEDDDSDDDDDEEDAKPAKKSVKTAAAKASTNGKAEGNFEIVAQMQSGEIQIVVDGKHALAGWVLDLIDGGADSINIVSND
jgi:hypothetical protein